MARTNSTLALCAAFSWLVASPSARADVCVARAHIIAVHGANARVESLVDCRPEVDADPAHITLTFAYPLPLGATITTPGYAAQYAGGRIVGVSFEPSDAFDPQMPIVVPFASYRFSSSIPVSRHGRSATLAPPLLAGSETQFVVFRDREITFEVSPEHSPRRALHGTLLEGADAAVASSLRHELRRTGARGERLIVSVTPTIVARGGIAGRLESRASSHRSLTLALGIAATVAVAVLAVALRRWSFEADLEHAEAVLEREWERLPSG